MERLIHAVGFWCAGREENAEKEKAMLQAEKRRQLKQKKKKAAKLEQTNNHFELKVLVPKKNTAVKKSGDAEDFMKVSD